LVFVMVVASNSVVHALQFWRDVFFPMKYKSAHVLTHGFTHTLFFGLGTEPNPWGIHWGDDESGLHFARQVDPAVDYCTKSYFSALGRLYLKLAVHHPRLIVGIYAAKIKKTLLLPIYPTTIPIFVPWGMGLLCLVVQRLRRSKAI